MENKFEKLYYLENIDSDEFTDVMEEKFVFCGTNWGFCFSSNIHPECEKIENVKLVKGDFNKKDPIWIDYDAHLDLNLRYSKNG